MNSSALRAQMSYSVCAGLASAAVSTSINDDEFSGCDFLFRDSSCALKLKERANERYQIHPNHGIDDRDRSL